ncbi:MAG: hypothetical protein B6D41_18910 [Chloroflexi bacterium UTCFX4]|nr:MAG: hypothetical protein B6D41_18910 [Chloroflexi bacterium UTCFX4]
MDGRRIIKWHIKVLAKSGVVVHPVPRPRTGMIIRGWMSRVIHRIEKAGFGNEFRFFFCQFSLAMLISEWMQHAQCGM